MLALKGYQSLPKISVSTNEESVWIKTGPRYLKVFKALLIIRRCGTHCLDERIEET